MNNLPESIKDKIRDEARSERQKFVKDETQNGTPSDSIKYMGIGFKEGYIAGASSILQEPGKWGLAGRLVPAIEIKPEAFKNVPLKVDGTWCNGHYDLNKKLFIAPWGWIENTESVFWLDESAPAQPPVSVLKDALEKIAGMKREPGETDDKCAFNRCWHIATNALNQYNQQP